MKSGLNITPSEEAKHIAHLFGILPGDFARNSAALATMAVTAKAAQAWRDTSGGRVAYLLGHTPEQLAKFDSSTETTRSGFEGTGMNEPRASAFIAMFGKSPAALRAEFPNLKI